VVSVGHAWSLVNTFYPLVYSLQRRAILPQWPLQRTMSHTHTQTTVLLLVWNMSGSTRVSRYQKGKTRKVKTNLDLREQEIVSGSGICWVICKSAPHPRQPRQHPATQFFTGRMPFLTPNQQRQSTEGITMSYTSRPIHRQFIISLTVRR